MAVDVGPPPGGGGPNTCGLTRQRPERSLLALRRAGVVSAEQVEQAQRAFLLEAVAEAVVEVGYARTNVREVIARAHVSRRTFYQLVSGVDDCFLQALTEAHGRVLEAIRPGGVSSAVADILTLLDADPLLAGLCVVGAPTGPPEVLAVHQRFLSGLSRSLDAPERTARALTAGAFAMVHERLTEPSQAGEPLIELADEIVAFLGAAILLPVAMPQRRHLSAV